MSKSDVQDIGTLQFLRNELQQYCSKSASTMQTFSSILLRKKDELESLESHFQACIQRAEINVSTCEAALNACEISAATAAMTGMYVDCSAQRAALESARYELQRAYDNFARYKSEMAQLYDALSRYKSAENRYDHSLNTIEGSTTMELDRIIRLLTDYATSDQETLADITAPSHVLTPTQNIASEAAVATDETAKSAAAPVAQQESSKDGGSATGGEAPSSGAGNASPNSDVNIANSATGTTESDGMHVAAGAAAGVAGGVVGGMAAAVGIGAMNKSTINELGNAPQNTDSLEGVSPLLNEIENVKTGAESGNAAKVKTEPESRANPEPRTNLKSRTELEPRADRKFKPNTYKVLLSDGRTLYIEEKDNGIGPYSATASIFSKSYWNRKALNAADFPLGFQDAAKDHDIAYGMLYGEDGKPYDGNGRFLDIDNVEDRIKLMNIKNGADIELQNGAAKVFPGTVSEFCQVTNINIGDLNMGKMPETCEFTVKKSVGASKDDSFADMVLAAMGGPESEESFAEGQRWAKFAEEHRNEIEQQLGMSIDTSRYYFVIEEQFCQTPYSAPANLLNSITNPNMTPINP